MNITNNIQDNTQKQTILMCPPTYFDVNYEINPWMNTSNQADKTKAKIQWQNLYNKILELGHEARLLDPVSDNPDLVYVDAGLALWIDSRKMFIPSNFKYPERQSESVIFASWFEKNNYEILWLDSKYKFEGHGDTLWAGKKLFCGHGFRSQKESYLDIKNLLESNYQTQLDFEIITVELSDPRFYHLDTTFCPINENLAICYEKGITKKSLDILKEKMKIIAVDDFDATKFACNSLVLGKDIIMPAGSKNTIAKLTALGYRIHEVDVAEFIKGGGACKCMSMPIL